MSDYPGDCTCADPSPSGHDRCPQHGIQAPAEPVEDDAECCHCYGSGVVEDDAEHEYGGVYAVEYPCDRCEGTGRAPVDANDRCACDDCLTLPYDERVLSLNAAVAATEATTEETPA